MQVELVFFYELLRPLELAAEEVDENAGMRHDLMVLDVGVDQKLTKQLLDLIVEILLVDLLCIMDGDAAFVGLL